MMVPIRLRPVWLVLLVVAVGCSGAVGPTPTPTAPATPGPTPTVTPTVAPSAAVIAGTMTATLPEVPEWSSGGFPGFGRFEVGDARAAGDYRTVINWGADDPEKQLVLLWGTSIIWNDGGTWQGPWTGWRTYDGDHVLDSSMAGSGEYAGLALSYHATAPTDDSIWQVTMSIEAALEDSRPSASPAPGQDGVTVSGVRSCTPAPLGDGNALGSDPPAGRAEVSLCAWDVSDDRLAGIDTTLASFDTQADGSVDGWGSVSLRSSTGALDDVFCGWLGSYSLHTAANGSTTVSVDLTGLGTCEGLAYSGQESGSNHDRAVTGAIWGTAIHPAPMPSPTLRAQ